MIFFFFSIDQYVLLMLHKQLVESGLTINAIQKVVAVEILYILGQKVVAVEI